LSVKAVSSIASVLILLAMIASLWILSTNSGQIASWILSTNTTDIFSDINVVRDNLKMLCQMQATVIAILISLSLAAVELAASTYSLRLFRSFSTSPWIWIVTVLYVGSIAFDLSLLTLLMQSTAGYEKYIVFSYLLGIINLSLLIPYWRSMTEILSPDRITRKLAKGISHSSAAFQPIDDIICVSLTKYDYETARTGMQVMNDQVLEIVKSHNVQPLWDPKVPRGSRHHTKAMDLSYMVESTVCAYCGHLERLGKLFARKEEEMLALQTSQDLSRVGYALAEGAYPINLIISSSGFDSVMKALTAVGSEAAQRRIYDATKNTIENMSGIATSIQYEVVNAFDANARRIVISIDEVSRKAIESWSLDILFPVVKSLGSIGKLYSKNKFNWASSEATRSIIKITTKVLVDLHYLESDHLVDLLLKTHVSTVLLEIGKISCENALQQGTEKAAWGLWDVGFWASIRKLPVTMEDCARGLAELTTLNKKTVNIGLEVLRGRIKDVESHPNFKELWRMYLSKLARESDRKDRRKKKNSDDKMDS